MRRAKVADKVEMHSKDEARTGRDDLKFLAFSPRHIRSGGEALQPCDFDIRDTLGAPINAVREECDISHCVDPLFVRLQVLVHRASAGAAERSIRYELQVWFRPDGDYGEPRGKSQAALSLNILDYCFSFESVQVLVQEQLDTGFLI